MVALFCMVIPQDIVIHGIHVVAMDDAYETYAASEPWWDVLV